MPDPTTTETMDVDLPGGVKVALPKADALKVIAERDTRAAAYRAAQERIGALDAAKAEAERKAAEEVERAKAIELGKKGEVDELRRLLTAESEKKAAAMHAELVRLHLSNQLATNAGVVQTARDDAISLIMSSAAFKVDGGKVQVVQADGKPLLDQSGQPIGADAYVSGWLKQRPHYLKDSTPNGTGGADATKPAGPAKTITIAEYDAIQVDAKNPGRAQQLAQDIAAKRVVIAG